VVKNQGEKVATPFSLTSHDLIKKLMR